jgi:hypothetical protein
MFYHGSATCRDNNKLWTGHIRANKHRSSGKCIGRWSWLVKWLFIFYGDEFKRDAKGTIDAVPESIKLFLALFTFIVMRLSVATIGPWKQAGVSLRTNVLVSVQVLSLGSQRIPGPNGLLRS